MRIPLQDLDDDPLLPFAAASEVPPPSLDSGWQSAVDVDIDTRAVLYGTLCATRSDSVARITGNLLCCAQREAPFRFDRDDLAVLPASCQTVCLPCQTLAMVFATETIRLHHADWLTAAILVGRCFRPTPSTRVRSPPDTFTAFRTRGPDPVLCPAACPPVAQSLSTAFRTRGPDPDPVPQR